MHKIAAKVFYFYNKKYRSLNSYSFVNLTLENRVTLFSKAVSLIFCAAFFSLHNFYT